MKTIAYAIFLALALCACESQSSSAKPPVPAASAQIATQPAVPSPPAAAKAKLLLPAPEKTETLGGWLTIGISAEDVLKKLGEPEKGDEMYMAATGTYVQKWRYADHGLVLQMEAEQAGGPRKVGSMGITLVHPGTLQTEQKIGIGSPAQDVRDRYAQLVDSEASDEKNIVVGSVYEGTIFTIGQGVVRKVFIGAAAE